MVSKLALLSNLFLAFAALAPSQLGVRLARGEVPQSQSLSHIESRVGVSLPTTFNVQQAGGQCQANAGYNFNVITANIRVPHFSPSSISGVHVWVGIGNSACGPVLLAGIRFTVVGSTVLYFAAFGLAPNIQYTLIIDPIRPGDFLRLTAIAGTVLGGVASIENLAQGRVWSKSQMFTSSSAICDQTAQWIVQPYADATGTYVTLANFGTISFYDAIAGGPSSYYCVPSNTFLLDILRNGVHLTDTWVDPIALNVNYLSSG